MMMIKHLIIIEKTKKKKRKEDRWTERQRQTVGVKEKKAPLLQAVAESIDGLRSGLVPLLELRHRHRLPTDLTYSQKPTSKIHKNFQSLPLKFTKEDFRLHIPSNHHATISAAAQ